MLDTEWEYNMGQNVNYLLGNQSQMLGADPELYRQQLIQQEQQRIAAQPVQNQLGATVGGLLGRGIGNLATGNNFFEVTNPVLKKLTQIQDIYSTSLKESDPNDPSSFYTSLQKNFADAGLGQQAMMAQVEAKKFEGVNIKSKSDLTELYTKNPGELANALARAKEAGDTKAIENLTTLQDTIEKKRGLDFAKEEAQTNLLNAQTAQAKAAASKYAQDIESGKFDWKIINDVTGTPTHMAKIDKKTGETTYEAIALPPGATPPPGAKPAPKTEIPGSWKLVPTPGVK
jgi:hypothetical protein